MDNKRLLQNPKRKTNELRRTFCRQSLIFRYCEMILQEPHKAQVKFWVTIAFLYLFSHNAYSEEYCFEYTVLYYYGYPSIRDADPTVPARHWLDWTSNGSGSFIDLAYQADGKATGFYYSSSAFLGGVGYFSLNTVNVSCPTPGVNYCVGNPINPSTGYKFQVEWDYKDPQGYGFDYKRLYSSGDALNQASINSGAEKFKRINYHGDPYGDPMVKKGIVLTTKYGVEVFKEGASGYVQKGNGSGSMELIEGASGESVWRYTNDQGVVEEYSYSGVLQSSLALSGYTKNYSYNNDGILSSIKDNFGRELSFSYNAQKKISTVTTPDGVISYEYDSNNNLSSVTYPNLTTRTYIYDDPNFPNALTGIVDENNNRYATWSYDDQGLAISSEHAGGVERTDLVYNADGSTTVYDSFGVPRIYRFASINGVRKLIQVEGPSCQDCDGGSTSYDYDSTNNNLISKTENGLTTRYGDYDAKGNYGYKIEAVGTPEQRRFDYTYDSRFFGKVTSITEASVTTGQQKVTI